MHKLTDLKAGITVNVGLVKGGQSVNTTAPLAEGQIDLRYVRPEQRGPALAALQKIIDTATVPGTIARLEIKGEFLPVSPTPASEELFGCYQAAAADAGLNVAGEFTGGARTRFHVGGRLSDAVRGGAGRRQRAHARGVPRSTRWCPRPGYGARHSAPAYGARMMALRCDPGASGLIGGCAANWFTMSKSEAHPGAGRRAS